MIIVPDFIDVGVKSALDALSYDVLNRLYLLYRLIPIAS